MIVFSKPKRLLRLTVMIDKYGLSAIEKNNFHPKVVRQSR